MGNAAGSVLMIIYAVRLCYIPVLASDCPGHHHERFVHSIGVDVAFQQPSLVIFFGEYPIAIIAVVDYPVGCPGLLPFFLLCVVMPDCFTRFMGGYPAPLRVILILVMLPVPVNINQAVFGIVLVGDDCGLVS